MAFERDLELDDVRDTHIREAYEEGRLVFQQGMGTLNCPHCSKGVGLLLPGNALGRTSASRTLLVAYPAKSIKAAVKRGDVVVVEGKVRPEPNTGLSPQAKQDAILEALKSLSPDEIKQLLNKVSAQGGE